MAHGHGPSPPYTFNLGDLMYLHEDRDKNKARDKYLVCSIDGDTLHRRKFVKSHFGAENTWSPSQTVTLHNPLLNLIYMNKFEVWI